MPHDKLLMIITAVYIAGVLLFPIRKGKQRILPWLFCTALQLGCIFHFSQLRTLISGYLPDVVVELTGDKYLPYLCGVILAILNIIVILMINSIIIAIEKRKAKQNEEKRRASMSKEQLEAEERAEQLQMDIAKAAININSTQTGSKNSKRSRGNKKGRG